ncbi:MAG: T9SS type A sorting domain-containing protein, partial [Bacteroidota bacterium]
GRSVRKFDPEGNDEGLFINANLSGPTNIWFDDNGDLLVADYNGTAVKRFDSDGNYLGDFLGGLSNAEGAAYLPNGNILIGNGGNSAVKMYSPEGAYLSDFISSGSGNLIAPNAVVIRDLTAVNTTELNAQSAVKVSPTVGTHFYLESPLDQSIEVVRIYNPDGRLISTKQPLSSTVEWQANTAHPDGLYLLEIQLSDGSQTIARAMVQH